MGHDNEHPDSGHYGASLHESNRAGRNDSSREPARPVKAVMALALGLFVVSVMYSIDIFDDLITRFHTETEIEAKEVFLVAEIMPGLIGGLSSIQEKIRYPETAKEAGIEGRVFLQFIVDENGSVVDPIVVRGIGYGCDEAALEALKTARFTPGMQSGKPVQVKMSLPVVFRLR